MPLSGWLNQTEERHLRGRRKAMLFAVLAVLWVFPSAGALGILCMHWAVWSEASTVVGAIKTTRVEQWIAAALLATHAAFVFLARHYARHEPRLRQEENAVDPLLDERPGVDR